MTAAGRALLPSWRAGADVLVVGTGVAGLTAAHRLSRAGISVLVVTKADAADANTTWAQGGVAVVRDERDPGDCVAAHVADTVTAGAGLCDPAAVEAILTGGPGAVARLLAAGAVFDCGPAGLLRTREGGHSARRVIHAGGDATGAEIERALLGAPLPAMLTGHQVLDVVCDGAGRVVGALLLGDDGGLGFVAAPRVVLATGGGGHLYSATTNPGVATADGVAIALRAGAVAADVEFMQFHPTVLYTGPGATGHRPLITEAVRGEGAVLIDATGARVMAGVHPLEDLAPRDVVSLAVSRRMADNPGGVADHVFLDARRVEGFAARFPTVWAACRAAGTDPADTPIPVAPAAHYYCGGVLTDLSGSSTVPGLYAVGEAARTGLHGANRLASNSLLEGLVMGERVAAAIIADPAERPAGPANLPLAERTLADPAGRAALQAVMSLHAGIGRDADGLAAVARQAAATGPAAAASRPAAEAANLALVSAALATAAAERAESRGCHVRTDYPGQRADWRRSIGIRLVDGALAICSIEFAQACP